MFKCKITKLIAVVLLCCSFIFSSCGTNLAETEQIVIPSNNSENILEIKETAKPFVSNLGSQYSIVVPDADYNYEGSAKNYNVIAYQELVYFINQAVGCTLNVVSDSGLVLNDGSKYISLGETTLFEQSGIEIDKEKLGDSGYVIKTVGDSIFICGAKKLGSLYGVYELLKHTVGYEYYSFDEIYLDKVSSVNLLDFNVRPCL